MQYVRAVDFGAFPPGIFHSQRLADASTGLDSCVCLCTRVPPGTGTSSGLHIHPCDQLYYVLTGTMHAEIGDRTYEVGPDTLVIIPAGAPHWNWNEGPTDELHFEILVPAPAAGSAVVTPVDREHGEHLPPSSITPTVRPLDRAQFDTNRFSEIVLADRSTDLTTLSLSVFRVPAGGQGPTLHVHRFDQIYYITDGTMQIQIGLESYTAGPHTLVTIPAGMPHRNLNAGPEAEFHLNLRIPEPSSHDVAWDLPVQIGSTVAQR
jgi:mannose-6-phosphate isomerase-like protein (cupin superfamily)